jgi:dienelactone hydrolase
VGRREDLVDHAEASAIARVGDIAFLISTAVERLPVRDGGVGVTGASFGGYSSLVAPTSDGRVAAIAAMCPANDDGLVLSGGSVYNSRIRAPWKSDPATLILAGDRDSLLPLYGQLTLLKEVPATRKQVVAMARADHNHFVDDIELGQAWLGEFVARVGRIFPEGPGNWSLIAQCVQPMEALVPGAEAKLAWQGIIAAHFDAHLRDDPQAMAAVADIEGLAEQVGVEVTTIGSGGE